MEQTMKFKINDAEITLENKGENAGQISINDLHRGYFEMYWGAMGGTIQEFILRINSDYFADKLLGLESMQVFNAKSTFRELRKFIREELDLPWYKHQEFQRNLREKISLFQLRCEEYNDSQYFVDHFNFYLVTMLNFNLIDDRFERERLEESFKGISEPWQFIGTKESDRCKWLKSLHSKIKSKIAKQQKKLN